MNDNLDEETAKKVKTYSKLEGEGWYSRDNE